MSPLEALALFDSYCQRHSLDHRPTVWAKHYDIWGVPHGEMGVPATRHPDDSLSVAINSFGVLIPFMVVPTIGLSWLVVDDINAFAVARFLVSTDGINLESWRVPYGIEDDGSVDFGIPDRQPMPDAVMEAFASVLSGRKGRVGWADDLDFEGSIAVAQNFLKNNLDR